ncbi:MAG TPA: hypothetical protein VLJ58_00780 [Ramlibacter sp.]|nr:hypothetical protein [Ramlibacter sp.]
MGNSQERSEDFGSQQPPQAEQADGSRSGEGAASAMQRMISQDRRHRRQAGEPDDPRGGAVNA